MKESTDNQPRKIRLRIAVIFLAATALLGTSSCYYSDYGYGGGYRSGYSSYGGGGGGYGYRGGGYRGGGGGGYGGGYCPY